MSRSWKEQPIDSVAEARTEVNGQRRREIVGRKAPGPPRSDPHMSHRGPLLVRNPKDYPTYPKTGTFRYSGLAKGYLHRCDLFLRGRTDEVPPTFWEYEKDTAAALRDCEAADEAVRLNRANECSQAQESEEK